jgi:hypothetical protein
MSNRQGSGVRIQGAGGRGQRSGFGGSASAGGCRPPAASCGMPPTHRRRYPTVRLIALLASLLVATVCRAGDSAAERRQRIENMTPAEKKQLQRKLDRFAALPLEEQQRLRQLHRQVESDPNADQLRLVMHAYFDWLKSLPAYTRTELLDLTPAKRIERIKQLRAEEDKGLNSQDLEGLFRWIGDYAADPQHQAEILKSVPERERQRFFERGPDERAWMAGRILWEETFRPVPPEWEGWPDYLEKPDWLTDDELANLRKHLSEHTRKRLAKLPPVQQFNAINGWFHYSAQRGFSGRGFRGGPPPKEFQQQLDHFFEELTPEEKDELLNLPGDEMQRELQRLYFRQSGLMLGPMHGRRPGSPGSPRDHSRDPERGPGPADPGGDPPSRER